MRPDQGIAEPFKGNPVTHGTLISGPAQERVPVLCGLFGLRFGGLIPLPSLRS